MVASGHRVGVGDMISLSFSVLLSFSIYVRDLCNQKNIFRKTVQTLEAMMCQKVETFYLLMGKYYGT